MSPAIMFHICGNSSILVFLKNFPTRVTLRSSTFAHWGPFSSASVCIERNLYIINGFPSFPRRSCLNSTGPFESSFIAAAIIGINKSKTRPTTIAATMSKARLKNKYALPPETFTISGSVPFKILKS